MKVLLINSRHSLIGGVERVYFNSAELLTKMGNEVQYFSVLDNNTTPNAFSKYFVEAKNIREASFINKLARIKEYTYNKRAYSNLVKLIHDFKPDIAHIHLFCAGLSASILKALKENNIPIVHTVHDYRLVCPANLLLDSKSNICEKCKNKSYYQCAVKKCVDGNFFYSTVVTIEAYYRKYFINPLDYIDHFIFVSHFSRNKHSEFDPKYSERSSILNNFTDLSAEFDQEYLHDGYYLYFGRLSKEKGIKTLLEAAARTGINIKIAGNGPLFQETIDFSNKHHNIQVLGHQSGDNLSELIRKAYFIILPSECYENNPMAVLEGYAHGKPVIGSMIGGIPEIVKDNINGFLFEAKNVDELVSVIFRTQALKKETYIEMAKNARFYSEQNSTPESYYQELIEIYNDVINNAKIPSR